MATKYGLNATKEQVTVPPDKIASSDQGGKVRRIYDSYALTADLASADIIKMGSLIPAGARILDVYMSFDDLDASGGTLDVGWAVSSDAVEAADDDGFMLNVDVTSAGFSSMLENHVAAAGRNKKFASPVQCQIKVDGDTDATSGNIELSILYSVE